VEGSQVGTPQPVGVTSVYLVRHADAGSRQTWRGPDDRRPLSEDGRRQARGLVDLLASERFDRVVSSPSLRCVQTVEPLAEARRVAVEEDARLLEGHDPRDTVSWLQAEASLRSLVACTHGDLVPAVLTALEAAGASVPVERRWPKASTWVLEFEGGRWARARYVPPPG
jgi:broad specificity phosphatase PhoE